MSVSITENEALAKVIAENIKPQVIDHEGKQFLVHPKNAEVTDLKELVEKYQPAPDRRVGLFQLGRTASLIDFANRYKGPDSIILAEGNVTKTSIEALVKVIFNAHPQGIDQTLAGHGDFLAEYRLPVSKELNSWLANNGKIMGQGDFALFIEDHVIDMADPLFSDLAQDLERVLAGRGADPITMLELSRGLEVRVNEQVKNQGRLQTGETQLVYSVEHAGTDGSPLKVPSWFLINVPVFEGDAQHIIPVRLRYRVKEGKVTWAYELFRIERTFDQAFADTLNVIQTQTGLPLFITP